MSVLTLQSQVALPNIKAADSVCELQNSYVEQGGRSQNFYRPCAKRFNNRGYIYLLGVESGGVQLDIYKIGKAKDFWARYQQILAEYSRPQPILPFRLSG